MIVARLKCLEYKGVSFYGLVKCASQSCGVFRAWEGLLSAICYEMRMDKTFPPSELHILSFNTGRRLEVNIVDQIRTRTYI